MKTCARMILVSMLRIYPIYSHYSNLILLLVFDFVAQFSTNHDFGQQFFLMSLREADYCYCYYYYHYCYDHLARNGLHFNWRQVQTQRWRIIRSQIPSGSLKSLSFLLGRGKVFSSSLDLSLDALFSQSKVMESTSTTFTKF